MNDLGKSITRKLSYSFGANIVSLLISVLTVSFIPKYMTVSDYGLYQLFLFYFGYIGFLHFGVLGGAIIRYAGSSYFELDYNTLKTQCCILLFILLVLSFFLYLLNLQINIFEDTYIIIMFFFAAAAQHIIWYSVSMLQMSNRIEDAAKLQFIERVSWGVLSVSAVILGFYNTLEIIFVFCITRIISMIYSLMLIPEIVKASAYFNKYTWNEFKINFALGFPITLSDICSILILGIIRFSISDIWDLSVFAKTSLVLTATMIFLTFVSSASVVLLPALRQVNDNIANAIFKPIDFLVSYLFLISLLFCYPAQIIIGFWLPKYADSLVYMWILFPVIYFEGKFNLLIVTYLKKLLKTKLILYINIFTMILSLLGCFYFGYYLNNLELIILWITIVFAVRCTVGEFVLFNQLANTNGTIKEYIFALLLIAIFEIARWISDSMLAFILYFIVLAVYSIIKFKQLKNSWFNIRQIIC